MSTTLSSPPAPSGKLLKKGELAANLNVTPRYIEMLAARKAIPVIRLGRRCVRYDLDRVKDALSKLEIKAA